MPLSRASAVPPTNVAAARGMASTCFTPQPTAFPNEKPCRYPCCIVASQFALQSPAENPTGGKAGKRAWLAAHPPPIPGAAHPAPSPPSTGAPQPGEAQPPVAHPPAPRPPPGARQEDVAQHPMNGDVVNAIRPASRNRRIISLFVLTRCFGGTGRPCSSSGTIVVKLCRIERFCGFLWLYRESW